MKTPPPVIRYNNHNFYIQQSGRYYSRCAKRSADEALLHRQIYRDAFGPIPDGMVVHHRDGDWQNNDICNLELCENGEHHRKHAIAWHRENPEHSKRIVDAWRSKASEWHGSGAGRKWHAEHATKTLLARPFRDYVCKECGATFQSRSINPPKFCKDQCRWKSNGRSRNR